MSDQQQEHPSRLLKAVTASRLDLVSTDTLPFPWETDDPFPTRSGRRCSRSEATLPLPMADGAYTAPISLRTREHVTERVGTQRDENPMGTRVSATTGDRAGSLGMGIRGLAVKGSGVRIPSAPRERETLEPQPWLGFRRVWRCPFSMAGAHWVLIRRLSCLEHLREPLHGLALYVR